MGVHHQGLKKWNKTEPTATSRNIIATIIANSSSLGVSYKFECIRPACERSLSSDSRQIAKSILFVRCNIQANSIEPYEFITFYMAIKSEILRHFCCAISQKRSKRIVNIHYPFNRAMFNTASDAGLRTDLLIGEDFAIEMPCGMAEDGQNDYQSHQQGQASDQ
jgi:hypothetical protein